MGFTRRDFLWLSGGAVLLMAVMPDAVLAGKRRRVPVLMYHDIDDAGGQFTVSPPVFSAQMEWLHSNGYRAVSIKELSGLDEGGLERAVVITFDDGFASFMDYAFPLFEAYGFKSVINIIGEHVGGKITNARTSPTLSWDEYRHLAKSALVELGCHTHGLHAGRGVQGVPAGELARDLRLFQETMERETGRRAEILAWPYGRYDGGAVETAVEAGFKYILTSNEGYLDASGPFDEVPRLNINNLDLVSFRQYLEGE